MKMPRNLRMKTLSKRKLAEIKLPSSLVPAGEEDRLLEQLRELSKQKGRIYAFYHKGELAGLFVFSRKQADMELLYVNAEELLKKEKEKKRTSKKPQFVYQMEHCYIMPGYEGYADAMKERVLAELKEAAEWYECRAILWQEECIQIIHVRVGATFVAAPLFGICVGVLFGIALDNLALGICFGVCMAMALGGIWQTAESTGKKEQEDKKEE